MFNETVLERFGFLDGMLKPNLLKNPGHEIKP